MMTLCIVNGTKLKRKEILIWRKMMKDNTFGGAGFFRTMNEKQKKEMKKKHAKSVEARKKIAKEKKSKTKRLLSIHS